NHTALYLERILFVSVGLALATQRKQRQLWLAITSLIVIALALTASRGAWVLGVPVGCGVFVWFGYTRRRTVTDCTAMGTTYPRQWLIIGLSISSIALVSIVALLWGRLSNSATIASRWQIWQNTLALWQDYAWVGVGPGGFFWRYAAYLKA